MCVSVAVIQRRAMPMKMNRAEFRCVQIVFVGKVIHKVIVNLYTVEVWEVHFCVSDVLLIWFKFLNTFYINESEIIIELLGLECQRV